MRALVLLGLIFGTIGCNYIQTSAPLSDPFATDPDDSLYGHWVMNPDPSPRHTMTDREKKAADAYESHLFIGKSKETGAPKALFKAVFIGWNPLTKEVSEAPTTIYFTTTKYAQGSFASILRTGNMPIGNEPHVRHYEAWTKDNSRNCWIVRYARDREMLQLCLGAETEVVDKLINESKLKRAAAEKRAAGSSSGWGSSSNKLETESLAAYLKENHGDALFGKEVLTLRWVPPVKTTP